MRKILSVLILSVFLVGLVAPMLAQGQEDLPNSCKLTRAAAKWEGANCPDPTADGTVCPFDDNVATNADCGMCCLLQTVYNVCDWLFYLMIVAVVIVFVIAGAKYMMAAGDSEKAKGGKGMMIYGIVGLVIALIAKLIPSVVKLIVGM